MRTQLIRIVGCISALLAVAHVHADDATEVNCTLGGSVATGMVVHLDPDTGMPASLPTPEQARALAALQAAAANRSSRGLVEEDGPTGGKMVNLQNRYRSPVVALIQEDGSSQVDHLNCTAAGGNS